MSEIVAMHMLFRERAIEGLKPLFASDKFDSEKLQRKLKSLMYPEEKYDELWQMKKNLDFFKKIRGMEFMVKPA
jgi:hypothetical protein